MAAGHNWHHHWVSVIDMGVVELVKTPQELRDDIKATRSEIGELMSLLDANANERKKLIRKLRELQYLQLWRADLLRSMGESIWNE
jgi:hypothetical protein